MNAGIETSGRDALRREFGRRCGLGAWHEHLLAGDASFRRHWRWSDGARSRVIMDAPTPQEDVRPYVRIARHLAALGLSTPEVLEQDPDNGFLLLEDFGDELFPEVLARRLPATDGGNEAALFALAADVLVHLHRAGAAALLEEVPRYDSDSLAEIATALVDWYLPMAIGRGATAVERDSYIEAWRSALKGLASQAPILILRDYHIGNLMWLCKRPGVRACGVLDFQDAGIGVAPYDVASLIEDARRDISDELRAATLRHYLEGIGGESESFDAGLALLVAQRHSRVIGVFARLRQRDGKPHYLQHLPRLWRLFDRALARAELEPVRRWIAEHLPPSRRVFPAA